MPDLDEALKQAQPAIRDALAQAEREVEELAARRAALEALIARAHATLGERSEPAERRRTLHQALELILSENGNDWMTVSALAKAVNERGLYVKRDGSAVEVNQVHARTHNYEGKFEKDPADRSRVRLRQPVQ
jgi:multidrug resistance efflux pump